MKSNILIAAVTLTIVCAAPSTTNSQQNTPIVKGQASDASKLEPNRNTAGTRHKRWYNYHGIGHTPLNPSGYPPYAYDPPSFTSPEQHFMHIHNRLREIHRELTAPPIPSFFPVIFVPQFINCGCQNNETPKPTTNETLPDIEKRFPEMDDPRQNWGFEVKPQNNNVDYSRRPINLEPYQPDRPLSRPPPPVEHGSVQGDVNSPESQLPPVTAGPVPVPAVPAASFPPQESLTPPSSCDAALIACCVQNVVTHDCFKSHGCPDSEKYGNLCDASIVESVISRAQRFYMAKKNLG